MKAETINKIHADLMNNSEFNDLVIDNIKKIKQCH